MTRAVVRVEHGDAVVKLPGVRLDVGGRAEQSLFFAAPQREPDGTARGTPQGCNRTRRFKDHRAARAVVLRSCAVVPRIKMRADDDPLVWLLAPANLRDDVVDLDRPAVLVRELKLDGDLSLLGQTHDELGI